MNNILTAFKAGKSITLAGKEYSARYPVGKDVKLKSVEVFEHAGNSAIYEGQYAKRNFTSSNVWTFIKGYAANKVCSYADK